MSNKKTGFNTDVSSNEDRQTHMLVLSMHQWLMWLAIVLILAGLLIWGIFGYITQRTTGSGLILPAKFQIAVAQSRMQGNITDVHVMIGDKVKKGDVIANIVSIAEEGEISETEVYLKALKEQQKNYLKEIKDQRDLLKQHSDSLEETYEIEQESLSDYKKFMDIFLKDAKKLRDKGAISRLQFRNYLNELYELKSDLSALSDKRANSIFEQSKYGYNWIQDTYRIKLLVLENENKLKLLKKKRAERSTILAPINGIVIKVFKDIGDVVDRGTTFATIVNEGSNESVECITLVPIADGKRVKLGMDAYISPTVAKKEIYGTITGKVKQVYEYPLSVEDVSTMINDRAIAKILCKDGPAIAVEVAMDRDKSTISGYKWTSNKGPDFKLTNGTLCVVDFDVKKRRPITLVIPYIREFIGYRY
ncbi:MAG TPA: NHLP bacteriocin system secretion protein [Victivallales bacterium]|nr:NHLP bacteriocin system secretion protein [Victivallales bacterium]